MGIFIQPGEGPCPKCRRWADATHLCGWEPPARDAATIEADEVADGIFVGEDGRYLVDPARLLDWGRTVADVEDVISRCHDAAGLATALDVERSRRALKRSLQSLASAVALAERQEPILLTDVVQEEAVAA